MRKLLICLLFLPLCAFGQQWTVIQSVSVFNQTQAIPQTTLLTPSDAGVYRLTYYLSGGGGASPSGYYNLILSGNDISGGYFNPNIVATCGIEKFSSAAPIISLMPNEPLTYKVDAAGSLPSGCNYNLTITVEKLQ